LLQSKVASCSNRVTGMLLKFFLKNKFFPKILTIIQLAEELSKHSFHLL
jgi:hypothetical protein